MMALDIPQVLAGALIDVRLAHVDNLGALVVKIANASNLGGRKDSYVNE